MHVRRLTGIALAIAGLIIGVAAPASALPPAPNDAFADALAIPAGGLPYQWQANTDGVTTELGEPTSCSTGGGTVWFTLKMPTSTFLRADTLGSDGAVLAVFQGSSVDSLSIVSCGSSANANSSDERVVWRAKAGVTYRIRVGGHLPGTTLNVRKVPPPPNDDFAKAKAITAFPTTLVTDLMNGSREPGDPVPDCASQGLNSIWYRIASPTTRTIQVDATDTPVDTYLLVTTGSKLSTLDVLDCQDDISEVSTGSRITFTAKAGKTYFILLAGYQGDAGKTHVTFRTVTPPANDAFAKARTLPANGSSVKGDTTNATTETGEPLSADACGPEYNGSTVWYTFVAGTSANHTIETYGSWIETNIGVYTGSSLGSLAPLVCVGDSEVTVSATSGTRYYVQIGGFDAEGGPIQVRLSH